MVGAPARGAAHVEAVQTLDRQALGLLQLAPVPPSFDVSTAPLNIVFCVGSAQTGGVVADAFDQSQNPEAHMQELQSAPNAHIVALLVRLGTNVHILFVQLLPDRQSLATLQLAPPGNPKDDGTHMPALHLSLPEQRTVLEQVFGGGGAPAAPKVVVPPLVPTICIPVGIPWAYMHRSKPVYPAHIVLEPQRTRPLVSFALSVVLPEFP